MKNLCYNIVEKRKRETKNVPIFQKQTGEKIRCKIKERHKGCGKLPSGHGEEIKGKEGTKSDDSLPRSGE